jgi:hypothetical protein
MRMDYCGVGERLAQLSVRMYPDIVEHDRRTEGGFFEGLFSHPISTAPKGMESDLAQYLHRMKPPHKDMERFYMLHGLWYNKTLDSTRHYARGIEGLADHEREEYLGMIMRLADATRREGYMGYTWMLFGLDEEKRPDLLTKETMEKSVNRAAWEFLTYFGSAKDGNGPHSSDPYRPIFSRAHLIDFAKYKEYKGGKLLYGGPWITKEYEDAFWRAEPKLSGDEKGRLVRPILDRKLRYLFSWDSPLFRDESTWDAPEKTIEKSFGRYMRFKDNGYVQRLFKERIGDLAERATDKDDGWYCIKNAEALLKFVDFSPRSKRLFMTGHLELEKNLKDAVGADIPKDWLTVKARKSLFFAERKAKAAAR